MKVGAFVAKFMILAPSEAAIVSQGVSMTFAVVAAGVGTVADPSRVLLAIAFLAGLAGVGFLVAAGLLSMAVGPTPLEKRIISVAGLATIVAALIGTASTILLIPPSPSP